MWFVSSRSKFRRVCARLVSRPETMKVCSGRAKKTVLGEGGGGCQECFQVTSGGQQ